MNLKKTGFEKGSPEDSVGSIYCVGRNYIEHAKELNNPVPKKPLIFLKSRGCLVPFRDQITLDIGDQRCDYETEVAVVLKQDAYRISVQEASEYVSHVGLALDLTLRDLQQSLKSRGHPWELAKNFVNACPLTPLRPVAGPEDLEHLFFDLRVNGDTRQSGNLKDMIFSVSEILAYLSQHMPLRKGDLVLTGTPSGVGALQNLDYLEAYLNGLKIADAKVRI